MGIFDGVIKSRHPEYTANATLWQRRKDAYFGGAAYIEAALNTHRLENAGDFTERKKIATLLNYLRPICDTYATYLFRREAEWELELTGAVKYMDEAADREGRGFLQFMKSLAPLAVDIGFVLIGIDTPTMPEGVELKSRAQEDVYGIKPYLYYIDPLDLLDWETDEDGYLVLALLRETISDRQIVNGKVEDRGGEQYRLWTPGACIVINKDGDPIEEYVNEIGLVPIVPLKFRDTGDPITGQGLGQDLEPIQAEILNVCSQIYEIFQRQTFSQLVAQGDAADYGEIDSTGKAHIGKLSTASIMIVSNDAKHMPQFISPDVSQAHLLREERDRLIDEMYRIAQLTRGSAREATPQSGISKAFDFLDTNQALGDFAENVAKAGQRALEIAALYSGSKDESELEPPADFGVVDLDADVDRLDKLVKARAPYPLIDAVVARVAETMFPGDDDLQKALKEEAGEKEEPPEPIDLSQFQPPEEGGKPPLTE